MAIHEHLKQYKRRELNSTAAATRPRRCHLFVLLHTLLSILTRGYFIPPNGAQGERKAQLAEALLSRSQRCAPQTPIRCSLSLTTLLLGVCRHLLILRACGSLRANRAVTFFAVHHLPTVASFQSFVPHSFHSATSATLARVANSLHLASLRTSISQCLLIHFNLHLADYKFA